MDALEDVELVIDNTSVDNVEDAHHDEYVENIGQVSARSIQLLKFREKRRAIPVEMTTGVNVWNIRSVKTEFDLRLRVEILSTKANSPHNANHIAGHGNDLLEHLS